MVFLVLAPGRGEAASSVLRFGIDAADRGTGDPHRAGSRNDRAVVDMIFNGLLRYKPGEAPAVEPDLAVEIPYPQIIDGKQVWRFELRRDVMCHSGPQTEQYQLTSDDVVFSLQRAADPKVSAYAGDYEGMTVKRVDDFTVDVIFDAPLSSILFFPKVADYAGGLIVCRKSAEAIGDHGLAAHPVGTGPFVFHSRVAGEQVRLVANESYFRGRPLLDAVEIHFIPKFEERDARLRSGELDVIFGSEEPHWFETVRDVDSIQVDVFGVGQVITMHFNTTKKPLDDRRVRQALAYAVDREIFRSLFAEGVVENVYSPVPADFLPGGLTRSDVTSFNVNPSA